MKNSRGLRRLAFAIFFTFAMCSAAAAMGPRTETQFGHNITVPAGEAVEDLTCFGCSIHIRGSVSGDVTTLGGSIVIEEGGQAGGDVTALGGDVRLESGASVGGDLTMIGGHLRRDSGANIGGEVTAMTGGGWMAAMFLVPFIFLGMLIAVLVWLVRRVRRPAVPLAA